MKQFVKVPIAALFFCALASCKKDKKEKVYTEENPLEKFYSLSGFSAKTNFINSGTYESSLAFSPLVKGEIKALTIKLPDANPTLKVTIWDYDTKTALRTETLEVTAANTQILKSIAPLSLEKDKKYIISMNSNDWYKMYKPDASNAAYPITAGNIKFIEYRWVSAISGTPKFPTNVSLDYNAGDLSFVFQQTE